MTFHDMEDEHSTPGYADPTPPREPFTRDPDEEYDRMKYAEIDERLEQEEKERNENTA